MRNSRSFLFAQTNKEFCASIGEAKILKMGNMDEKNTERTLSRAGGESS